MCIDPELHEPSRLLSHEASVGALRAGVDAKKMKQNGVIAVLTEITTDHVKMKRKCSLAIADLKSVDLENAITALRSLNPAENPAPSDIGELRIRLLKRVRQARSPEHIEQLHNALQTAAIIPVNGPEDRAL
jgi:hypothetical protein